MAKSISIPGPGFCETFQFIRDPENAHVVVINAVETSNTKNRKRTEKTGFTK